MVCTLTNPLSMYRFYFTLLWFHVHNVFEHVLPLAHKVKAHCEVEVCLERCVQHLRKQLLADARHASTSSSNLTASARGAETSTSANPNTGTQPAAWSSRGVFPEHDHRKSGSTGSRYLHEQNDGNSGDSAAPLTPGTAAGVVDIGVAGTGSSSAGGPGLSGSNWSSSSSGRGVRRESPKKGLSRVPSFFTSKSQSDLQRSAAEAMREEQKQAAAAAVEREVAARQAERKAEQVAERLARERQAAAWQQTRDNARAVTEAARNRSSDHHHNSSTGAVDGGGDDAQLALDEPLSSAGLTVGEEYFAPLKRSTTPTPLPPPTPSQYIRGVSGSSRSPLSGSSNTGSSRSMKCPAPFFSGHSVVDVAPTLLPAARAHDGPNSACTNGSTGNGSALRSPRGANWSWYGNDPLPANNHEEDGDGRSSGSSTEEEESGEETVGHK